MSSEANVLAIEIGGTYTRLRLASRDGRVPSERTLVTRRDNYRQTLTDTLCVARDMSNNHRIVMIGVSIAGVLCDGVLTGAGNLHDWVGHDIEGDLSELIGAPAIVLNDAQAGALGEYETYEQSLVYVSWGSGIGVAFIREGDHLPTATELGHLVIDCRSRLRCGCGGLGHWEAQCGGNNIPNRVFKRQRGLQPGQLNDHQWSIVLHDMAIGLRSTSNLMPGALLVLGGGIAFRQQCRFDELQRLVSLLPSSAPQPEMRLASHNVDSGLVGAAFAAWQEYDHRQLI